jgi:FMN phosphatase YigB (HAD superfamily)/ribulose-5-phosphate 4-epimerase/fuculose-1-phosphate aldolase
MIHKKYNIDFNIIKNNYNNINKNIKNSNNPVNKFNKIIYIKQLLEELNIPISVLSFYYDIFDKVFISNIKLYDNILDLLILLKNNDIKIGILSNNNFMQQLNKINKLKIEDYIDIIETSDECGYEKPDLNIYLKIINKFNLKPENIAYIGDNIDHDIIPSLKIGFLPFHFKITSDNLFKLIDNYFEFNNYNNLIIFFTEYFKTINELIFLSKYFGQSIITTQGSGGNVSIKLDEIMFIKSSGFILGNINYNKGYCILNNKKYLDNNELQNINYKIYGYNNPSMETFFHSFMKKYTIHIHFTLSNIFFCSIKNNILDNFKYNYKIIDYNNPGILLAYDIFKNYDNNIDIYFLKNHGLIITNDNMNEIITIFEYIYNYFNNLLNNLYDNDFISFTLNKLIYFNSNESMIIQYINYPSELIKKINYCFPDLAIYVQNIIELNNIEDIKNYNNIDLIIYNNNIFVVAKNINKIYNIIEILKTYEILYNNIGFNNLKSINNIDTLQNMNEEIYRKNI